MTVCVVILRIGLLKPELLLELRERLRPRAGAGERDRDGARYSDRRDMGILWCVNKRYVGTFIYSGFCCLGMN